MEKVRLLMTIRRSDREIKLPSHMFQLDSTRQAVKDFATRMLTNEEIKKIYYVNHTNSEEIQLVNETESIDQYINYIQQLPKKIDSNPSVKMIVVVPEKPTGSEMDISVNRKTLSFSSILSIFANNLDEKDKGNIQNTFTEAIGDIPSIFIESSPSKKDETNSIPNMYGLLEINRQPAQDVMDALKKGSVITLADDDGNYYRISFLKTKPVQFGSATWNKETDTSFKCATLKIPVKILQNEITCALSQTDSIINDWKAILAKKEKYSACINEPDDTHTEKKSDNEFIKKDDFDQILDEFKKKVFEEVHVIVEESLKKYRVTPFKVGPTITENEQDTKTMESVNNIQDVKDEKIMPHSKEYTLRLKSDLSGSSSANEEMKPSTTVVDVHEATEFDVENNRENKIRYSFECKIPKRDITLVQFDRVKTTGKRSMSHRKREHGKLMELDLDLFSSKSGYKLKMPPNSTSIVRCSLYKYGKYANGERELELRPYSINAGVECFVKQVTKDKATGGFTYDIRFKTKGKTGKFRCGFSVIQGERLCGILRVDVRVKKFYYQQDANYFSAEETPQVASCSQSSVVSALQSTRDAIAELADEGIACNGDETDWELSDSDLDVIEDKEDNGNDEGIDTGFLKNDSPSVDLNDEDEDSDTSVSLLLDENEVRDKVDDELDVVQIPMCFIPNAEMKKESLPIRIKRKVSGLKHDSKRKDGHGSSKQSSGVGRSPRSKSHLDRDESLRLAMNGLLLRKLRESFKNGSTRKVVAKRSAPTPTSSTAWDVKTDSTSVSAKASSSEQTPATVSTSLIANAKTETPKSGNGVPQMENESSATPPKEMPPSISIIPDKVLEMTSNVFKSVMNSVKSSNANETKDRLQKCQIDKTLENMAPLLENIERVTTKTIADVNSFLNGGAITASATESSSVIHQQKPMHKSTETADADCSLGNSKTWDTGDTTSWHSGYASPWGTGQNFGRSESATRQLIGYTEEDRRYNGRPLAENRSHNSNASLWNISEVIPVADKSLPETPVTRPLADPSILAYRRNATDDSWGVQGSEGGEDWGDHLTMYDFYMHPLNAPPWPEWPPQTHTYPPPPPQDTQRKVHYMDPVHPASTSKLAAMTSQPAAAISQNFGPWGDDRWQPQTRIYPLLPPQDTPRTVHYMDPIHAASTSKPVAAISQNFGPWSDDRWQPQMRTYPLPPPQDTQRTVHYINPIHPASTSKLAATTSQPAATTSQPKATTSQPTAMTSQPAAMTFQPAATTSQPAATTTTTTQAKIQQAFANVAPEPVKVTSTIPTSSQKPEQMNTSKLDEKYNEIQPHFRQQLLKLNEMGFANEERNLFYIRKYPDDLGKVVESLVNFSDM